MNDDVVIDVQGLSKRYDGRVVVDGIDMHVPRACIYGFLGPNGSGKTTTIRMLCGLLTPDAGTGTCLGYDIRREREQIKRRIGYMTQKFGLYEDLSIDENLDFIGRMYEVSDRKTKVAQTLERFGLTTRKTQLAGTLSGGWQQRLALAACLLHTPQLLLLDEPTAGVDPKARREFWDQLHALCADGLTVLVSTHYMDEAERCHRLAYIADGRLLAHGSAAELIASTPLAVCAIRGADLALLDHDLRRDPRIRSVASFGAALHASAATREELDAALAALAPQRRDGVQIEAITPNLEDIFIALMPEVRDNDGSKHEGRRAS